MAATNNDGSTRIRIAVLLFETVRRAWRLDPVVAALTASTTATVFPRVLGGSKSDMGERVKHGGDRRCARVVWPAVAPRSVDKGG
jgi:hypothetical protein